MSARRIAAVALSGALIAGGTGVALAAVSKDDGDKAEQAILDDAANRLDVAPEKLRAALLAAQDAQLDRAVKDGKLTQRQADAIKARRSKSGRVLGRPFGARGFHGPPAGLGPGFGPHPGARGAIFLDLAKALGISRAQLHEQLRDGNSVAEIAKAEGRSLDDVRTTVKAAAKARIDKAVTEGDITRPQGDDLLAHLDDAVEHLDRAPRMRRHRRGDGPPGLRPGAVRPGAHEAPVLEPAGVIS